MNDSSTGADVFVVNLGREFQRDGILLENKFTELFKLLLELFK